MSDLLLPCPFCGSAAKFDEVSGRDHPDFGGHFINCENERCQACVGLRYAGKEDPKPLLAEQWNRRAQADFLERLDKFITAVAPSKLTRELDSIRKEIRFALREPRAREERP